AETAEQDATAQRNEAVEANANLWKAREELWTNLYTARSTLIQNAWEADNVERVRELLPLQIPKEAQRDLRGFDWDFWGRLAHSELQTWSLANAGSSLSQASLRELTEDCAGKDLLWHRSCTE